MSDNEDSHVAVPLVDEPDMTMVAVQPADGTSAAVVSINNQHLYVVGLVEQAACRLNAVEREDEERSVATKRRTWRMTENALITALSALYAKLVVVLGTVFPVTEGLAPQVPGSFYQGFYLYLYVGSIAFVCFMYAMMLKERAVKNIISRHRRTGVVCQCPMSRSDVVRYGSFYLRLGAIGFGIGSMVYSGLEFGQHFTRETDCDDDLLVIRSATRMLLTLVQIKFIFLNNKDMKMGRYMPVARFGLMHMIATNVCEWLYVLVEETKHEIVHLSHYNMSAHSDHAGHVEHAEHAEHNVTMHNATGLHRPRRSELSCSRTNIVGILVQNASSYLYPCTIEYSLICAVTLYEMWKHIKTEEPRHHARHVCRQGMGSGFSLGGLRSAHHFSVDCHSAHTGLFGGILVLVLTIISLALFFVLRQEARYLQLAELQARFCEMTLYILSGLAALACLRKLGMLPRDTQKSHGRGLDNSLLVISQAGMYVYCIFSIIGFYYAKDTEVPGGMITEIIAITQTTAQTFLVLSTTGRRCRSTEDKRRKPGRQLVTFLLVANAAMWMVNTLEKGHAMFRPSHLEFFGAWHWIVITHVSMPLAIFYRFHSTICLFEIWKSAYKLKSENH
ncbi:proton channel OtopLc-like isoform X2 [Periplaneta americana]|uniref:proton channel OtopLc-like isoform X2 n=1 Tax=Periplaneta americana TaxID=6978 RepID=UPI0037E7F372